MPRDFMHIAPLAVVLYGCAGKSTEKPPATASESHSEHAHGGRHGGHPEGHHGHHHRFDDAAAWSKVFDDPARDEWQKPAAIVAAMNVSAGMTVADVGAGTGYFEPHLSRAAGAGGKVLAIDIEPDMVRFTNERMKREGFANVEARLGAPDDPKLAPQSIDRVLVVDVWHHIDDRAGYAKKLAAALRPGGVVFIVDFTKESPHGPPKEARLSADDVSADLRAAGLDPKKIEAGLPYQYMIAASRPSTL